MGDRIEVIGDCTLYLGDCRDILPTIGPVDAVVTDPPYGIGAASAAFRNGGGIAKQRDIDAMEWDSAPADNESIAGMLGVSRSQIIFGGNYFALPPSRCWLVWDKLNGENEYADCELAWTNLDKPVRRIRYLWHGMMRANGEERGDHPTQKPVGVMSWALQQLPPTVKTVIDPFMGSGTTGVACVRAGLSFVGIEREERYFEAACRRIREEVARPRLFTAPVPDEPVQPSLLGDAA